MTPKEEKFCCFYALNGNARLSAVLSGYKNSPEIKAVKLLSRKDVGEKIRFYRKAYYDDLRALAITGYRQLAFGSIADCIKLIYDMDNLPSLDMMNLFMISEIKKPKDGSMEIKFFDRIKALEKLTEIEQLSEESSIPFYKALEKSADIFSNDEEEENVPE
ncbi:MAG: terminase small subunit [Clostridia bacterium]|nr:terminase small subunit [Clostridia bacterium]